MERQILVHYGLSDGLSKCSSPLTSDRAELELDLNRNVPGVDCV